MKISRISAQAFRGFPGVVHFQLSLGITIVYAPNGSGKTSLSEAFEWALYGEVARKLRSKTPGEFGQDFLRSAHANPNDETWAEVELLGPDGTKLVIRRTMDKGGQTKLEVDGKAIADVGELSIATGLAFRPCLGQSEIKAFIDTEPKERWKQISAILGLGGFDAVRERLMKLKADTDHNIEVTKIREAARRAVAPLLPEGTDPLSQDPDSLYRTLINDLNLDDTATWEQIQHAAEKRIAGLLGMDKRPASLDQMVSGPEAVELEILEAEVNKINDGLKDHRDWHQTNKKTKFIELGLDIAKVPECPFCSEATVDDSKLTGLKKYVEEREPAPPELNGQFSQAIGGFQIIKDAPINTKVIGSLVEALAEAPELTSLLQALPDRQSQLLKDLTALGGLARGYLKSTQSSDTTTPIEEVQSLGNQLLDAARKLASDYTTLRADGQRLRENIQAKFSGLNVEERAALERYQAMKKLASDVRFVLQAWAISQRQAELERFIRGFEQAEKNTVQSKEQELADDVRAYYSQLSNSKSLEFKGFRIKPGVRRQAALEATAYSVPVNPTSMFSEAQGNCLGLSLYFSQRVKRNPGWTTIILDDPVQSMDEDHKDNLITVLSSLSQDRQIIVFTHDKAFRNSLATQFQHDPQYLGYEITKTDKSPVPKIAEQIERLDQLLNYADICADGPSVQRESAFNTLRKAVERLTKDLAAANGVALSKGAVLETHINELLNNPLSQTDCGTMQRVRHGCNPNSHDAEASDAAGTIRSYIANIKQVRDQYIDTTP